jgi:hypothetical protein
LRLEGLGKLITNAVPSSGLEHATFRPVTWRLNHLRYRVPHYTHILVTHLNRALHILSVGHFGFLSVISFSSLHHFSSTPLKHCAPTVFHLRLRLILFYISKEGLYSYFSGQSYEQKDIITITVAARSKTQNVFPLIRDCELGS